MGIRKRQKKPHLYVLLDQKFLHHPKCLIDNPLLQVPHRAAPGPLQVLVRRAGRGGAEGRWARSAGRALRGEGGGCLRAHLEILLLYERNIGYN